MSLKKEGYIPRIIDDEIDKYLRLFGAISIEGPKWCGKTWTALNHGNSVVYINDSADNYRLKRLAQMDVNLVLGEEAPEVVDEWQEVPEIWDTVRFKCDQDKIKGKYILTGSATPVDEKITHSGAGRIARINMYPMSLFESNDSDGKVSLKDLFEGSVKNSLVKQGELYHIAELIVRGGWPEVIGIDADSASIIAKSYIEDVLKKDINSVDGVKRDSEKMQLVMRSLARNESTLAQNSTIIRDIANVSDEAEMTVARNTVSDYLSVLTKLHMTKNQPSFKYKIRSSSNVGKVEKRHFVDPSLACALLSITPDKLMKDLNTFGFYFEALCERDLRIYIESLGGNLYHYRDNNTGNEVDAIVELADGEYGAIEIKLGSNEEEDAVKTLKKFYHSAEIKPKFMAVICGLCNAITKRPDGIYVLPITCLKN